MTQTYFRGADYRDTMKREDAPAREAFTIVPDAANLTRYVRSLWINTSGTVTGVSVDQQDDIALDYVVSAGTPLPIGFRRITAAPTNTRGLI